VLSNTWKAGCVIHKACIFAQFTTDGVNVTPACRAACVSSIMSTSNFADTTFFGSTPIHFHGYDAKYFAVVAQA
jgi:hypothetical protein